MKYDVLLTDAGHDSLSIAFAVMNTIQQLSPMPVANVNDAREWVKHLPVLLRRGVPGDTARELQQRYEQLGAATAIVPSKLFFPENTPGISRWRNEWFSAHLVALHESVLSDWVRDSTAQEAYRFSYLPSFGIGLTLRLWQEDGHLYGSARRSIGRIGPLPGPPGHEAQWSLSDDEWQQVIAVFKQHSFWESDSWNTVPDGHVVMDSAHWVMEGWRDNRYHALFDQTPDDGPAREVGLFLLELLPESFKSSETE